MSTRYYSPNLGRFLNADALASTGQGILGNNMFAYCGNNPVSRMDDDGEKWTYTIEKAETNILEEETDRTVYQTTIVFSGENTNLFGTATKTIPSTEVTLKYSISNDGAIAFDNVQDDAVHLKIDAVRNKLAAEMYNVCTNSVRNSLSRRTIAGISNELYWHYIFSFTKSGKTANIGGSNQDDPGRDSNGWLFEIFCVKQ